MRRSHKKSRRGCLECKRRHIKCDETHPSCLNCVTAERACSYPERVGTGVGGNGGGLPVSNSPTASTPGPTSGPTSPEGNLKASVFPTDASDELPVVNMVHLELFNHFSTELYLTSLTPDMAELSRDLTIKYAMVTPYLMHQILALGARHYSVLRPERKAFYRHQAIQLQTSALSLFNRQGPAMNTADRIPMLLFSSLLGFHALCDTLSVRDATFEQFFSRFMSYLRLHRGVHSVIAGFWPTLLESEMRPILDIGTEAYQVEGTGHECDGLRARFQLAGFDEETTRDCLRAIGRLQYVLDGKTEAKFRAHVVISFPLFFAKPAAELIYNRNGDMFLLLAYYAVALHYCRNLWVIGDAGRYVFEMITSRLGPEYDSLLEWPRQAFATPTSPSEESANMIDPDLTQS